MKLGAYMHREGLSDADMAARIRALDVPCSLHTIKKWRRGERTPQGRNMSALMAATNNDVTANDFYTDSPTLAHDAEHFEAAE